MDRHEILAEFDYSPGRIKTLFLGCLATAGAVMFVCFALFLPAREDRVLFGVLACLSPIGVFFVLGNVYMAFASKRRIALTPTSVLMPRPTRLGMSCEEIEIPFTSIRSAEVRDFMQKQNFLRIEYDGGIAGIMRNMLRQPNQFDRLHELIQSAVAEVQSQGEDKADAGDE